MKCTMLEDFPKPLQSGWFNRGMLEGKFSFRIFDCVSIMRFLFMLPLDFLSVVSTGKSTRALIFLAMLAKPKGLVLSSLVHSQRQETWHPFGWCRLLQKYYEADLANSMAASKMWSTGSSSPMSLRANLTLCFPSPMSGYIRIFKKSTYAYLDLVKHHFLKDSISAEHILIQSY